MQQETFQAKDYKISISDSEVILNRVVTNKSSNYWLHSFILLFLLMILNIKDISEGVQVVRGLLWVIVLFIWSYPHFERIFTYLFFEKWGNRIAIKDISKIQILEPDNDFEVSIKIWTKSKRRKLITFRTAENQLENCVEAIKSRNPLVSSAIYGHS